MIKKNKRASDILASIANDEKLNGDITFYDIVSIFGTRAFGISLLFFALPSALPLSIVPGISVIFSLPILFLAIQMVFLRNTIWLPQVLSKQCVSHKTICKIVHTSKPYLEKAERLLKPRLLFMTSRPMEVINGLIIACLSILLMLPIPLSNFIFSGLIIMLSLGLIEKDGVFIIAGYVGFILYTSFIYTVIVATIKIIF